MGEDRVRSEAIASTLISTLISTAVGLEPRTSSRAELGTAVALLLR